MSADAINVSENRATATGGLQIAFLFPLKKLEALSLWQKAAMRKPPKSWRRR